jgi:hypothetical protein
MGRREGLPDLEALKAKVMAPSVKQALKAKQAAKAYQDEVVQTEKEDQSLRKRQNAEASEVKRPRKRKAEGEATGIKVRRHVCVALWLTCSPCPRY